MEAEWEKRINIDPAIQGGKPVIAGTRVPLYVILRAMAGGDSIEDVCNSYAITEQDVRAALAYAAETIFEEVVHAIPSR